jgi:hypothetical protein
LVTPAVYPAFLADTTPLTWTTHILAAAISVASAAAGYVYGASRGERQPERPHDEDGDEDSVADGDLSAVSAGFMKPCKLVRFFGIFGLLPA